MLSGTLRRSFWIFIRLHFSFLLYFFSFLSIKQEVRNLVQLFFPWSQERIELGQSYFINSCLDGIVVLIMMESWGQIFLDMAVLVEAQGELLDNIESQAGFLSILDILPM